MLKDKQFPPFRQGGSQVATRRSKEQNFSMQFGGLPSQSGIDTQFSLVGCQLPSLHIILAMFEPSGN